MRLIFCDSGFSPKDVDFMYAGEYVMAQQLHIPLSLLSFEALKRGDMNLALKGVKSNGEMELGIYRGWMLKPHQYNSLYNALLAKNIKLINNPSEYKFCHYLLESYNVIKNFTPNEVNLSNSGVIIY